MGLHYFRALPFLRRAARMSLISICCIAFVGILNGQGGGLNGLALQDITVAGLTSQPMEVTVDTDAAVEGFTIAIALDPALLVAQSISAAGVAIGADFEASFVDPAGGAVLQVVMDQSPPIGDNVIAAGDDLLVARLYVRPTLAVGTTTTTALDLVDGVFGSPPVANQIVRAGVAMGAAEGLVLTGAVATLLSPPPDTLRLENTSIISRESGDVRVLLTNESGPVQGFSLAVCHDASELQLEAIVPGTVTVGVGAEFVSFDVSPPGGDGGILGAVLDLHPPFAGQTIPMGVDQHIASFVYTVIPDLVNGQDAPQVFSLQFVDALLGQPLASNRLQVQGVIVEPQLIDASVTALPHDPPVDHEVKLYCGPRDLQLDSMGNPLGGPIPGLRGESVEVCILYTSETHNIQGLQFALCLDCELIVCGLTLEGTIAASVGAEFVAWNYEGVRDDGDGCELVGGVLLDALPPFDRQTLPPTSTPLPVACIELKVSDVPVCRSEPGNPVSGINFYCGPAGLQLDGMGNPVPAVVDAIPGQVLEVCFFYTSEFLEIGGFQLGICYDCDLSFSGFSVSGSAVGAVGAEFVNYNIDNDPNDGDGCEMVVGILLDVLPPFNQQTLPITSVPLRIGCVQALVSPNAACEDLLTVDFCDYVDGAGNVPIENIAIVGVESVQDIGKYCCGIRVRTNPSNGPCDKLSIEFCDDINGAGVVIIENLVVIDNQSVQDLPTCPCEICLQRVPNFMRGDCNQDEKVDITDANTVLAAAYQGFDVDCADACDANDDGFVNLADTVYLLTYLFGFGPAIPSPTFPDCGPDLTLDEIDCLDPQHCVY